MSVNISAAKSTIEMSGWLFPWPAKKTAEHDVPAGEGNTETGKADLQIK